MRYSNILSGLFHSKVVVCESDSDCKFYQAIADAIHDIENTTQDILFVHCGGKQRFKTIIKALKTLNVKTVIIADIDILNDQILFQSTIESFGLSWTDFKSHWKILDNFIKNKKPQLDMLEVKAKIEKIINEIPKSAQIFPATSIEEIKSVIKNSSAWSLLKDVGINFLSGEPLNSFNIIDKKCRDSGLFIVPVGELEGFYKNCSNHGPQWVNDVLDSVKDLSSSQDLDDARKFLKEIIDC